MRSYKKSLNPDLDPTRHEIFIVEKLIQVSGNQLKDKITKRELSIWDEYWYYYNYGHGQNLISSVDYLREKLKLPKKEETIPVIIAMEELLKIEEEPTLEDLKKKTGLLLKTNATQAQLEAMSQANKLGYHLKNDEADAWIYLRDILGANMNDANFVKNAIEIYIPRIIDFQKSKGGRILEKPKWKDIIVAPAK